MGLVSTIFLKATGRYDEIYERKYGAASRAAPDRLARSIEEGYSFRNPLYDTILWSLGLEDPEIRAQ